MLVGEQLAAGRDSTVGVLHVVETDVVGLPHVDAGSVDRVAVGIGDRALDPARLARRASVDVAAEWDVRGAIDEERAEHRRLGGVRVRLVVDGYGRHRRTEDSGEQNEFLAVLVGDVPAVGQERNGGAPSFSVSRTSRMKA